MDASFPVGLLTCVTGVSGSGKSTLVNDILANAASFKLNRAKTIPGKHERITGLDHFMQVVRVDQSPIVDRPDRIQPLTSSCLICCDRCLPKRPYPRSAGTNLPVSVLI